jgi:methionine-gamma-lyase
MNRKGFATLCAQDVAIENLHAHTTPIYATSTFTYNNLDEARAFFRGESDAYVYSRLGNPTVDAVAEKIAKLEAFGSNIEAFGKLFASGMGAIASAILAVTKAGDTIITQGNLYGTTHELLAEFLRDYGISCKIVELRDLDIIDNMLLNDESIKLIYIETPANPTLECYDLEGLANIAKAYNAYTIVDNTFATPYLQRPLQLGIDIVVHSSTKYLNGHGTGTSGVVVARKDSGLEASIFRTQKLLGAICSPLEAYLLNNGIKTLPLRMERHQSNALLLAQYLSNHPKVKYVNYLGLESHKSHLLASTQMGGAGGMLSFDIDGSADDVTTFLKKLNSCTLTASLGTADTLISNPATMSHIKVAREQRLAYGITDTLIRISVGFEDIEDIIEDISQALG